MTSISASTALDRRLWTLDDVRSLSFVGRDALREDAEITAYNELRIGERHHKLHGPCLVCGRPTGVPEPLRGNDVIWVCTSSRRYCSRACQRRYYRERENEARARIVRPCAQCGEPIPTTARADARFCSGGCKQADYRRRVTARASDSAKHGRSVTDAA